MLIFNPALVTNAQSLEALFAPKSQLWQIWTKHDPHSVAEIDHSVWNRFLANYVLSTRDGINRVAYGQVSKEVRETLSTYIKKLTTIAISRFNRSEQLVFWINLYNSLTIIVILDHYPVASIRDIDISPGLFVDGPWDKKLITVEDEAISLNDIEHRILRPIWRDPRIHYVVNCASLGCPNLAGTAFTSQNIENDLNAAANAFINHPRAAQIESGKLTVSSIYSWFQEDFGNGEAEVIEHLKDYASPSLKKELEIVTKIEDYTYDWGLNDL